jgi:hypothetical protein
MRQRQQEQESIFGLAAALQQASGPRIATYNAPPPPSGPKVKMHADSSQVSSSKLTHAPVMVSGSRTSVSMSLIMWSLQPHHQANNS